MNILHYYKTKSFLELDIDIVFFNSDNYEEGVVEIQRENRYWGIKIWDFYFSTKQDFEQSIYWCKNNYQQLESVEEAKELIKDTVIQKNGKDITFEDFKNYINDVINNDLKIGCSICYKTGGYYQNFHHCLDCVKQDKSFSICNNCFDEGKFINNDDIEHTNDHTILPFENVDLKKLYIVYAKRK